MADTKIEYRVKRVSRYVITKHSEDLSGTTGSTVEKGTYDNPDVAYEVAYALCKQDHERLGYPPGDERVVYPERDDENSKTSVVRARSAGCVPGFPLSNFP
ncbi:hypothetical protein V1291_000070 [Nitrobacteraceae bacterium AZCC 1564]